MAIETYPYRYDDTIERGIYYRVPKYLFEDEKLKGLSAEAKIIYSKFLELLEFSAKRGWVDDEGRLYIRFTLKNVESFLGCSNHKARDIFRELGEDGIGLITRVKQGRGKTSKIYIHKYIPERTKEYARKNNGCVQKNNEVGTKSTANKNINNYKNINNKHPYNYLLGVSENKYTESGGSL